MAGLGLREYIEDELLFFGKIKSAGESFLYGGFVIL
jgi:hypothetical protein